MVGVALFSHEDAIHAPGDISKDGVTEIVKAVRVLGIVGIGIVGKSALNPAYPAAGSVRRTLTLNRRKLGS